jgi:hypothetical protein
MGQHIQAKAFRMYESTSSKSADTEAEAIAEALREAPLEV